MFLVELLVEEHTVLPRKPCKNFLRYPFSTHKAYISYKMINKDAICLIIIENSKDTWDSLFSAKSSRHFESGSSLHVQYA